MKWKADAPSNIALIKYMGKSDLYKNLPANPSFSYTLNHLSSFVEIEEAQGSDRWEPLHNESKYIFNMSPAAKERFLKHFSHIKEQYGCQQNFILRSTNNFPSDCGLASSASSFAALTKGAVLALNEVTGKRMFSSVSELSRLSRLGSGSSCRSFFDPWAVWNHEGAEPVPLPLNELWHLVVVVHAEPKLVSSREAHRIVPSSALFNGRSQRAQTRLNDLMRALEEKNWIFAYQIAWAEFWEMHALFETSYPPFGYMTSGTIDILRTMRELWRQENDGPIVTMDAGPNVHMLFRNDQKNLAHRVFTDLRSRFRVITNLQGS